MLSGVAAMRVDEIESNVELQQVLWACYKYWQSESLPPHERVICYSWVVKLYEGKFGTNFHQSKLRRLSRLGFLQPSDVSRGGNRRYYKIVDPDKVARLLEKWRLF